MKQDFEWIQEIIYSCNNDFHFDGVDKLIELFTAKHQNENMTMWLREQRQTHWMRVHSILM